MTSQQTLNPEDVIRYTQESVLYFLSQHTKNTTIKRADYVKTILHDVGRRMQNEIFKETKSILKQTYGVDIIELDENVKHYLLINELEYNPAVQVDWPVPQKNQQTLLLPILAAIFMNGGSVPEGEMWEFLQELKIVTAESRINEKFGDLDRLLKKDFVHQRYLIYESVKRGADDDNEKIFEFKWGIRARHEVSKEKILQHMSEIFDCEASHFAEQFTQISSQS